MRLLHHRWLWCLQCRTTWRWEWGDTPVCPLCDEPTVEAAVDWDLLDAAYAAGGPDAVEAVVREAP